VTDELVEAVMALVGDELGIKPDRLSLETRLLHDLGCDGDAATDLIQHFAQRFGVEVSTFQFQRHFGPEAAFNPLVFLYRQIFRPARLRLVPLAISDLVNAARTKRLRSPNRAAV